MTTVEPVGGLIDDAVAAELATGAREPSRAAALRAVAARAVRMAAGGMLLLVGLLLLVLPGPGLVVLLAGLLLLARDVAWAARLAERVRTRVAVVPRSARGPAVLAAVAAAAAGSVVTLRLVS